MTTVLGVPVSWMPLDFDQFFLPMEKQCPELVDHQELTPETDSVYSLVYGNQGEHPTMAMAQVGLDSDFGMDFGKFFNHVDSLDPDFGMRTQPIKEESLSYGMMGDAFLTNEVDPFSDGLERFLNEPPDVEEEMADIIGKKRERRSSLERRLQWRNGKEQNRGRERTVPERRTQTELVKQKTPEPIHPTHSRYLHEGLEMRGHVGRVDLADLPNELSVDSDPLSDSVLPYSVGRSNAVGMLVQDMVGFDIRPQRNAKGVQKTSAEDVSNPHVGG